MRDSSPTEDVLVALLDRPAALLELVGAEGAAVIESGTVETCGRTPSNRLIHAIAAYLDARGDHVPFATDSLAALVPMAAAEHETASGLLAFSLPAAPSRRLLWFRPELVRDVNWGGDPRKAIEPDPSMRIHPRRSFALWKEKVRLRSWPWSAFDLEAATELRRTVMEIDLGRQVVREQRAVRARDDLVAVVSHDLRSPLGVIQMQAGLIPLLAASLDDTEEGAQLRQSVERIGRAVQRMTALIRDLLDLAKIEAGRFEVHAQPEHIRDIVHETVSLMRPLAESKHVAIADDLESAIVAVDRERIYQVLSNLIGNAIKFTPAGGTITLHAERNGDELLITVADTGRGIAPDEIAFVFDRYWQARRSGHAGAGLGLYIARGIVEAHGGRMWVESPPGAGARFHFTLPIAQQPGAAAQTAP
jgi:light-regulated signal transduction histidine kinase (bacteriophytochrome)